MCKNRHSWWSIIIHWAFQLFQNIFFKTIMVSIPKSGLVMCRSLHITSHLDLEISQCRGLTADQCVHPAVSWFHLSVLQARYHHTQSQFKLARFKPPGCRLVSDSFSRGSVSSCFCPLCLALRGHLTSNQMNNLDKQDQSKGPVFVFPSHNPGP